MNKKLLPKLLIASVLVGGVNFLPVNFDAENLQIVSVAYAEVKTVTVNGSAGMSFGDNDEKILTMAKNAARMNAIQAAKEQAGIYIKSYVKTINGVLTDDYILAYASNNIKIISESYKKDFYNESDLRGNLTGNVGFKYVATVTAEIDTSDLQNYIQRDYKEKSTLAEQAKSSQKNISEINKNIADLNNTAKNKTSEEIQSEVQKIDSKILAEQKFNEGNELYYQKNYQGAISKYNDAIKLNPNYADAYNNRGAAYDELKNYQQAISDYNQSIKLNPNNATAYFNRGLTYANLQNYQQAISDWTQSIKINKNYVNAYYSRGIAYGELKNYQQAIDDYTKVIDLNKDYANAYYSRGLTYYKKGSYRVAILDYTQAIKLNPNYFEAYFNRGLAYGMLKNYEQAIKDFTEVIKLNPNDANAYVNRGITYKFLGDMLQAERDLAKARQLGYDG